MKTFRSIWRVGFLVAFAGLRCYAAAADTQVVIPAVQKGVQTDAGGAYKIEGIPAGSYVVEIRRVGYAPETRQADLTKGDATLNVTLSASPLTLAPITITAAPEA